MHCDRANRRLGGRLCNITRLTTLKNIGCPVFWTWDTQRVQESSVECKPVTTLFTAIQTILVPVDRIAHCRDEKSQNRCRTSRSMELGYPCSNDAYEQYGSLQLHPQKQRRSSPVTQLLAGQ
eukprot:scaffold158370_cov62-Attheya_sp.AAC.2